MRPARFTADGGPSGDDARRALATELRDRLLAAARPVRAREPPVGDPGRRESTVTGKTTTIAKLAHRLAADGHSVALAAADTFRAAAIEQLRIWGDQLGMPVIAQRAGADPGAVAFDAVAAAESRGIEAVLIDTAGRLQNKEQLMAELGKIRRVIERRLPDQPRHVLLVLDATTGQNGILQAEAFSREAGGDRHRADQARRQRQGWRRADRGRAAGRADPVRRRGRGDRALAPFDPEAYVEWLFAD